MKRSGPASRRVEWVARPRNLQRRHQGGGEFLRLGDMGGELRVGQQSFAKAFVIGFGPLAERNQPGAARIHPSLDLLRRLHQGLETRAQGGDARPDSLRS